MGRSPGRSRIRPRRPAPPRRPPVDRSRFDLQSPRGRRGYHCRPLAWGGRGLCAVRGRARGRCCQRFWRTVGGDRLGRGHAGPRLAVVVARRGCRLRDGRAGRESTRTACGSASACRPTDWRPSLRPAGVAWVRAVRDMATQTEEAAVEGVLTSRWTPLRVPPSPASGETGVASQEGGRIGDGATDEVPRRVPGGACLRRAGRADPGRAAGQPPFDGERSKSRRVSPWRGLTPDLVALCWRRCMPPTRGRRGWPWPPFLRTWQPPSSACWRRRRRASRWRSGAIETRARRSWRCAARPRRLRGGRAHVAPGGRGPRGCGQGAGLLASPRRWELCGSRGGESAAHPQRPLARYASAGPGGRPGRRSSQDGRGLVGQESSGGDRRRARRCGCNLPSRRLYASGLASPTSSLRSRAP